MEKRNLKNMILLAVAPFIYAFLLFVTMAAFDNATDNFLNSAFVSFLVILFVIAGLILVPVYLVYFILWFYRTALEMRRLGASVPNFILYFIPLANIYWFWVYSVGTEKVTKGKLTSVLSFVLLFLIGIPIAPVLIQYYFNQVDSKTKIAKAKKRVTKKIK
jgi:hypothetical protein